MFTRRVVSIQRELKQETGIEAESWRPLMQIDLSNSVTDEVAMVYLATGLSFGEAQPDDTEAQKAYRAAVGIDDNGASVAETPAQLGDLLDG